MWLIGSLGFYHSSLFPQWINDMTLLLYTHRAVSRTTSLELPEMRLFPVAEVACMNSWLDVDKQKIDFYYVQALRFFDFLQQPVLITKSIKICLKVMCGLIYCLQTK